jgi:mRNA-degrading endonuclease RelE of RelBE toxin-antitoxin system
LNTGNNNLYIVNFHKQFLAEFKNYPKEQQNKILDFIDIFEEYGLSDFTKYEGKIAPSWSGQNISLDNSIYAKGNDLWHYHIGIPFYNQLHSRYKTSSVVLHFQWKDRGNTIYLADIYDHYDCNGNFYLPPPHYLNP